MSKPAYTFTLLDDNPTFEDGFSGKGHERSASALEHSIKSASSANKSIGLEGAWGSGKSTVVAIAEKNLKKSKQEEYHFFTFDLWSHQGLDFRRAFLEEFLGWSKDHVRKDEIYMNLENQVLGKTKEIRAKNERQFSIFGYIFITAIFLLPFFALWLTPFAANLHKQQKLPANETEASFPWLFSFFIDYGHTVAAVLISTVSVGFLAQLIYFIFKYNNLRKALDASFSLFLIKSETDTVIQSIRNSDPTKYEFKKLFTEILSETQSENKRVVFLFDNIDRLPAHQIQETWSNIRAVITYDNPSISTIKHNLAKVIAVIPYDRKQTLQAFESKDTEHSKDTTSYVLEDVFRKTFNTIISVAPPITSDLNGFFNKCLDEANLNQFDLAQRHRLFQIYDTYLTDKKTNPTPRQIKSFINELGMLWMQWQNEISIESIAIFVLHRTSLESDPKSLQDPSTINARYRHFAINKQIDKEVAALAYNVKPKDALEVLMGRDIKSEFTSKDNSKLQSISKAPGFLELLDGVLFKECKMWATTNIVDFDAALKNFIDLDIDMQIKKHSNKNFINAFNQVESIEIKNKDHLENLCFLIELVDTEKELSELLKSISYKVNAQLETLPSHEDAINWIHFIGRFIKKADEVFSEYGREKLTKLIKIPYSEEFYLGVATFCKDFDVEISGFDKFDTMLSGELVDKLKETSTKAPLSFQVIWTQLNTFFTNEQKLVFLKEIVEYTTKNKLDSDGFSDYLINIENIITVSSEYKEIVNEYISSGALPWYTYSLHENENWNLAAKAIWIASKAMGTDDLPQLSNSANQQLQNNTHPLGNIRVGFTWFDKCYKEGVSPEIIIKLAIKFKGDIDFWLKTSIAKTKYNIYKQVVEYLFIEESSTIPSVDFFIENYSNITDVYSDEFIIKLLEIVGNDTQNDVLPSLPPEEIPPVFYEGILSRKEPLWKELIGKLEIYFKNIQTDDWQEMLNKNNPNRALFLTVSPALTEKIPPNSLNPALLSHVATMLVTPNNNFEDTSKFWSALTETSQKKLTQDILDKVSDEPTTSKGVFTVVEELPSFIELIKPDHNSKTCVDRLLIPLLSGNLETALQVVNKQPVSWEAAIIRLDKLSLEQLLEYLNFDNEDTEENSVGLQIKDILGL